MKIINIIQISRNYEKRYANLHITFVFNENFRCFALQNLDHDKLKVEINPNTPKTKLLAAYPFRLISLRRTLFRRQRYYHFRG